jgi:hypothetical protein
MSAREWRLWMLCREQMPACHSRWTRSHLGRSRIYSVTAAAFLRKANAISTPGLKLQLRLIRASKQVWWKIVLATDDVGQKLASSKNSKRSDLRRSVQR